MRATILVAVLVAVSGCGGSDRPDRCWCSEHATFGHDLSWCEIDGAVTCQGGETIEGPGCRWACLPMGNGRALTVTYRFTRNAGGDLVPVSAEYDQCVTALR